ncbi:MAG: HPr family phosphocarrier protein [Porticoccaceae bacterium]|nr:HPr family phosphocarrier protein [Porticoccaceae bacterium]
MIRSKILVINKLGLHARAATKLASMAGRYPCSIRTGTREPLVDAKSIMSLMLLAAAQGTELIFEFDGLEQELACQAITDLFADFFGEGE